MISATISGGTSAKNSAPEPHGGLHLDVFRLESRLPATRESIIPAAKNTVVVEQLFEKSKASQRLKRLLHMGKDRATCMPSINESL
jgi:hypothetical protein